MTTATTIDSFPSAPRVQTPWAWIAVAAGVAGTLAALLIKIDRPSPVAPAMALLPAVAALAAAALCFISHNGPALPSRIALAWRLFGVALACFAAGQIAHVFLVRTRGSAPSLPSPGDWLWALAQPLLWAGVLFLAWPGKSRAGARVISDALILVLAALVVLWATLLESLFEHSKLTHLQKAFALYYPLSAIILLFCVCLLLSTSRGRSEQATSALVLPAGLAIFIASNLDFAYHLLHRTEFHTRLVNLGWTWGAALVGVAAVASSRELKRAQDLQAIDESRNTVEVEDEVSLPHAAFGGWRPVILWLPYLAAILAAGVILIGQLKQDRAETLQRLAPVLALLFALVARQMLTLWDNLHLSQRLSSVNSELGTANATLQQHVRERSRHLTTLHGITSTLNTSVDRRTVLRVALERTMSAVGGEGGGIWLCPDADAREDIVPGLQSESAEKWTLVHWHSTANTPVESQEAIQSSMRDLAVLVAEGPQHNQSPLAPMPIDLPGDGLPSSEKLIVVPIRWQGSVIGALGIIGWSGEFSFEDRALVESVGLEAGTALQNVRLYHAARMRADHDTLTGLLNHRAMQEQLNKSLAQSRRLACELSIVILDLSNFKYFNDTYGHQIGDDVLRTVARRLEHLCRTTDFVGRYGGDEFILLLPETSGEGSQVVCGRVAAELDKLHFEADGVRIPITASFGSAVFPHDGASALELISHADSSLYLAKSTGTAIRLPVPTTATVEGKKETRRLKNRATGGSFGVLDALVTAIDNKDHYTRRHSEEVTQMALMIAEELGYTEEQKRAVRISGLLHDVGKIAVPDEILRHPGKLNNEQWEIMKQHPTFGALIVKDLPHIEEVIAGVRHHHERFDGKGYPDGLAGDEIPPMGRMLAVPDCYSAMTTDRPYRKGFTPEEALIEIERSIGTQFDPLMATTFVAAMRSALARNREHPLEAVDAIESAGEPETVETQQNHLSAA